MNPKIKDLKQIDDQYSNRFINLDPDGYFIIYIDKENNLICAEHYTNTISETGVALDPETGKPLPCDKPLKRLPTAIFKGRTAKEIGIKLIEEIENPPLSRLDHALYLGREFVRAEMAILSGEDYIQD